MASTEYTPPVDVDWAPTALYQQAKGEDETFRQAEQYARATATRAMPYQPLTPPTAAGPAAPPPRVETATAPAYSSLDHQFIAVALGSGFLGLFLGLFIGYKLLH